MATLDADKLIAFLREKWGGTPCPMCHASNWNVNNVTFQLLDFNPTGLVIGGPVFPVVPVVCNNCGNTIFLNAIKVGVVTPPPSGDKR